MTMIFVTIFSIRHISFNFSFFVIKTDNFKTDWLQPSYISFMSDANIVNGVLKLLVSIVVCI